MKKHMIWLIVFSVFAASGNLVAQERKKVEICLAGGALFAGGGYAPVGGASIGYTSKYVGVELNGAYFGYVGVFGANLVAGLFENKRYIPYATGGVWTSTYGGLGFYVGGGLKMQLSPRYAWRTEYRRYVVGDTKWGLNAIVTGVSIFF